MLAYPPIPRTAAASRTIGRDVATERSAMNGAAAERSGDLSAERGRGHRVEPVAGGRHERGFRSVRRADELDRRAPLAETVRDRDRGRDVSGRAAAGDDDPHRPLPPPPERERSRACLLSADRTPSSPTLAITPTPASVTTSAVPPNERNGSGHAGDRQEPGDGPQVHERLQPDPAGDPGGQEPAERIGGVHRDTDAGEEQDAEQRQDREGADQAELLPEDGEHEVAVGVGQVVPLLATVAEADAEPSARAERDQSLTQLPPGAARIELRVEPRLQEAGASIGRRRR